jgi:hypothetical protein
MYPRILLLILAVMGFWFAYRHPRRHVYRCELASPAGDVRCWDADGRMFRLRADHFTVTY